MFLNNNNNNNNNNNIVSCHSLFLPGTALEPTVIPTAQASSSKLHTFHILCDVLSIAVFCGDSVEDFLVWLPNFSLKPLITIPVALINIVITTTTTTTSSSSSSSFFFSSFFSFFFSFFSSSSSFLLLLTSASFRPVHITRNYLTFKPIHPLVGAVGWGNAL